MVFASARPVAGPAAEIDVIRDLGLPDGDTDAVLGGALARVPGLAS